MKGHSTLLRLIKSQFSSSPCFLEIFCMHAIHALALKPDDVKEILETSFQRITARHSQALVILNDYPDKQRELAERIVKLRRFFLPLVGE